MLCVYLFTMFTGSVNGRFELVSWQDPKVERLVDKISFSATEKYSNAWQFPNYRGIL